MTSEVETLADVLGPIGELAAHAIAYAEAGLDVFPVNPTNKAPLISQYEATTDLAAVDRWWHEWPTALIGHRLPAHQIVLDIDPRHGGHETWKALKEIVGDLPVTRAHASGRGDGGGHLWWLRPAVKVNTQKLDDWAHHHGVGHNINDTRWVSGIDILQQNHRYTILPPSPHPDSGKPYRWIDGRDLDIAPAPLPAYIADLIADEPAPPKPAPPRTDIDLDSPADWYSSSQSWSNLLTRNGWRLVAGDGDSDGSRWKHPTATSAMSATIRFGLLFVYSTSTPFEPTEPGSPSGYTLFKAFAVLEHGGDQSRAARAAIDLRGGTSQKTRDNLADLAASAPAVVDPETGERTETFSWQLPSVSIDEFLDEPEAEYDWLIPGLIERGDRIIVTAAEGMGKSTLIRQMSIQAAAGIHPFTLDDIDPIRVVVLDLENSRRHVRRQMRPLRDLAGRTLDAANLTMSVVPEGIDLMHLEGMTALNDLLERVRPDLVAVGPLYKLASGDPKDEEQAQAVRKALDHYRETYDCAFLIEAHQPYATGGSTKRPLRPYGASLWSRWPEFGIALSGEPGAPLAEIKHWRGARDERAWPTVLARGGTWPWEIASDDNATFAQMLKIAREHHDSTGELPSIRRVVELLDEQGITVSKTTVNRAIKANQATWDAITGGIA